MESYAGLNERQIRLSMKKADLIKWFKVNKAPMPKGSGKEGRVLVRDLEYARKRFLQKKGKVERKHTPKVPKTLQKLKNLHGSGDEKAIKEAIKKTDPKQVKNFFSKAWDGISNAGKKVAKDVGDHFVSKGWSEEHVASAMLLTGASAAAAGVVVGGLAAAVGGATAGIVPALMAGMFLFMPPVFKQLSKDTKLMKEAWADRREAEEELRQTREKLKYQRMLHGNLRISNNQQSNSEIQGMKKAFALLKRVENPKAFFKRVQGLAVKAFAAGEEKDIYTLMKAAL